MPRRLLVAHFLRQLLDNDLITPGADRHHALSVSAAALVTAGTFLTVALSIKYAFNPVPSPAETALVALDDVCLMSGLSMIVLAIVALASWDRLSLDARDTAIMGPLPVPPRELAAAQLTALALFAAVFSLVLNGLPSVLMPLVRVSKLHVSGLSILQLVAAQAAATIAAGVLGFVAIVAVRETLRLLVGSLWARGCSVATQTALVVMTVIALIGLPAASQHVARVWVESDAKGTVPPPVLFAALCDWIGGSELERMPPTMPPPDSPAYEGILRFERRTAVRYTQTRPRLAALGMSGLRALGTITLIALLTWGWHSRRLPQAMPGGGRRRRRRFGLDLSIARHQVTRAGIQLTMQTLSRSTPHRVVAAATLGIAVAATAICVRSLALGAPGAAGELTLSALAAQTVFLLTILTGTWQACRVPASLVAAPSFLLAWSGDAGRYVNGVRRAAMAGGMASVLLLLPLHIVMFGLVTATWHAVFGLLIVGAVSTVLFSEGNGLPLVSPYEPSGNVVGLVPIYLAAAAVVVSGFAWIERETLSTTASSAVLALVLALVWGGLAFMNRGHDMAAAPEAYESASNWETQHLSLSE